MRVFQLGWMGLVAMVATAAALPGGCTGPDTYPGDQDQTSVPGCMTDDECKGMNVPVCQKPACSGGECVTEPDDRQMCGTNPPMTHCEGGKCIGCKVDGDCPYTECEKGTCSMENECIPTYGPTDMFEDPKEDCTKRSCSDTGVLIKELDPTDGPKDDGNECTKEECVDMGTAGGVAAHTPQEGQTCGAGPTCSMVNGVDTGKEQDTCDAAGECMPGDTEPCFPAICAGNVCKASCASATDCADTAYCDVEQSKCFEKKEKGETCTSNDECYTASCFMNDGVCCNAGCSGSCKTCYANGMPGTCGDLPKGVVDTCPSGQACNDSGSCAGLGGKKAVGEPCSQSSDCFAHMSTGCVQDLCRLHAGETCDPAKPHECDANLCDATTHQCKNCMQAADCPSGACDVNNKRCYLAAGGVCGNASDCLAGLACTNNVCAQP